MNPKIPRTNIAYLRYILSKKNLSIIFYTSIGVLLIFIITIATLLLLSHIKTIFFVILLLLLATASNAINRFLPITLGVELIMMSVILASVAFSPTIGIMIGIISLTVSELIMMKFKIGLIISYAGLTIVGFLAGIFAETDITRLGITLTILYDALILPGYWFTGSNPIKIVAFGLTHIAFNVWVFYKIAPFMLNFMA